MTAGKFGEFVAKLILAEKFPIFRLKIMLRDFREYHCKHVAIVYDETLNINAIANCMGLGLRSYSSR